MHSAELKPLLPPALGCALVEEDRLALFEAAPVPPTKGQQTGDQDADVAGGQRHLVQAVQELVGSSVCMNLRSEAQHLRTQLRNVVDRWFRHPRCLWTTLSQCLDERSGRP